MASIFHQLGGQGPMPGLAPGDGGDDAGKAGCLCTVLVLKP